MDLISPRFQLLLVHEYQRLKANEQAKLGWSVRLQKLNQIAISQMTVLESVGEHKLLK